MIKTILFDMGGTLEDIWYNDQTIRTVTGELRTFLDEHDLGTGCNDITFWNKLNSGIRTYKQWSESNELEKKPEEIWPEYYMADFNLNRERLQEVAERLAGMWEVTYYHRELRPKVKETLEELKNAGIIWASSPIRHRFIRCSMCWSSTESAIILKMLPCPA